jgi:uncharacterized protein (TIGR03435 family)
MFFLLPLLLQAQQFEVASVKPFQGVRIGNQFEFAPNGDLRISNVTLEDMVRSAFALHEAQLRGGPDWIRSERWAIEAKVGDARADSSKRARSARLRKLLEDRFQLATHRETRAMNVLALVQAKGGHKLKPAIAGEERVLRGGGLGAVSTKRFDIAGLAAVLGGMLGRIVQDQTGLADAYAFELNWTSDPMTERLPGQPADFKPTDAGSGPSIYTALQQQLGLKLVAKRLPVEVVIIDRASRPSEN